MAELVVERTPKGPQDRSIPLVGRPLVAGRLQSCDLQLNDEPQASRKHFRIEPAGSRWILHDLGSRNGTFLNETQVEGQAPLRHHDQIRVGDTVVRLHCAPPLLPPGTQLGGVVLGAHRGRSEYGTLYHGRQGALEREVTVEVLDPDLAGDPHARDAYQRRARQAGAFEHPAILAVFDTAIEHNLVFTVFESLPPSTLEDRLRQGPPIPRSEARRFLKDLATALAHVHSRHQLHGALTPRAVYLDARQHVKLAGLGEPPGQRLDKHRPDLRLQAAYASPEEARREPLSPAADVYALGVLAHRLLLGRVPYDGRHPELLTQHADPTPVPLPPCPEHTLLTQLLDKNPTQRPPIDHVARAFADPTPTPGAATTVPEIPTAQPAPAPTPTPKPARAKRKRGPSGRAKRQGSSATRPARRGPSSDSLTPHTDSNRVSRQASERAARAALLNPPTYVPLRLLLLLIGYSLLGVAAALTTRVVLRLILSQS